MSTLMALLFFHKVNLIKDTPQPASQPANQPPLTAVRLGFPYLSNSLSMMGTEACDKVSPFKPKGPSWSQRSSLEGIASRHLKEKSIFQ